MEHGACNVIYIDRRANDEHVRRDSLSNSLATRTSTGSYSPGYFSMGKSPPPEISANVETIMSTFNQVHICGSGASCLTKISDLQNTSADIPTLVLIDVPYDEEQRQRRLSRDPRTASPTSTRTVNLDVNNLDDLYGMHLLVHISSEIQSRNVSKLVIPVVVLSGLDRDWASTNLPSPSVHGSQVLTDTVRLVRYLDAGAVDVLSSPLSKDHVQGLAVHAYRVHKEVSKEESGFLISRKNRKLSWVGVDDEKPYAYLREAMVSNLMSRICNPEATRDSIDPKDFYMDPERKAYVAEAIGSWTFSAHEFTDDELLYGALLMLQHALQMPDLESWRMSEDDLLVFLMASRIAYNEFVLYHNFRHVTDVLQALFYFLVRIGTLPEYAMGSPHPGKFEKPAIANLLKPFDALTLLISAIGHDVGHPGVNNAFLVALNAPLAQLYNDRSVLESFHCAAYSQILRRYWPVAFSDTTMRKLMINSILATDMGLHFKYMTELGHVQEKLAHNAGGMDGWSPKVQEEYKDLTCGLLIKCADISNVARKFDVAARWASVLTDEFSNQGTMEQELDMPSCLFGGPPVLNNLTKMAESQIGFMNIFARPLFEAVADILPAMQFSVDEILTNKAIWEVKIEQEKESLKKMPTINLGLLAPGYDTDPTPSPFSGGPVKSYLHSESLPAPTTKLASNVPAPRTDATQRSPLSDGSNRSSSSGSHTQYATPASGPERGSRRSSVAGLPSPLHLNSVENQSHSRRGSGDASVTAILVTQTPTPPGIERPKDAPSGSPALPASPSKRNNTKAKKLPQKPTKKSSNDGEKDSARPVTAPSSSRRSQGKKKNLSSYPPYTSSRPLAIGPDFDSATNVFPISKSPSQRHSELDLTHGHNGNLDGSRVHDWDSSKLTDDSSTSRPDGERDLSWWRQMSTRRRTRDLKLSNEEPLSPNKEMYLATSTSNTNSGYSASSTSPIQDRDKVPKWSRIFRRKTRVPSDKGRQYGSAPDSSLTLTTPPTSNPNDASSDIH
ncbi:HD-domain/PDEase-like protein [Mytilinidion resinicola]|uniref:Phosphodiesterase n=1 Tax=Mytilinidion resinicola TaxID=574789 RepID=A0A6A6Z6M1_9PEZI|nr:HD-domain/PDEase-like protein [Mytilinidion resinicola]KAF2816458.1 HD-domain/PDEase-like protein [Mytilinidion resinicola]